MNVVDASEVKLKVGYSSSNYHFLWLPTLFLD